jgi:exodeoxyribonuclease VII large subunit
LRLRALDPALILQRGYAWLTQDDGRPVSSVGQVQTGQSLQATLADGTVDLRVQNTHHN